MSEVISFHDEAAKQCVEAGERLGQALAEVIMRKVITYDLDDEMVEFAVNEAMASARSAFLEGGASENDTEVICQVIYNALIRKGYEISVLANWERGHA